MGIITELADDAVAFLKNNGFNVTSLLLSAETVLVAKVRASDTGTDILNLVQAIDSSATPNATKFASIVAAAVPLLKDLEAAGGLAGLAKTIEAFAEDVVQTIVEAFKADLAKVATTALSGTATA